MSRKKITIWKIQANQSKQQEDFLAIEEPLEIKIKQGNNPAKNISITMRTPGNDQDLALGFLFTEGIIKNIKEIKKVAHLTSFNPEMQGNQIQIELAEESQVDLTKLDRHFYTSSSCGVCGKTSIDAVHQQSQFALANNDLKCDPKVIYQLPPALRAHQDVFDATGGLHAAALFDLKGNLILLKEDVGRHNAVDKLIGSALFQDTLPLQNHILQLSGRASFELIQKAMMAGIQMVSAIGAPSSLAVELAKESDITLLGFVKEDRFNVYCRKERISNLE